MKKTIFLVLFLSFTILGSKITNNGTDYAHYNKNGKLIRELKYDEDNIGHYEEHYSNGNLKETYSYKDGEIIYEHKLYYENGTLQYEALFDGDEPDKLSEKYYYKNGALFEEISYNYEVIASIKYYCLC
jgi:antitoxin component YwqK of YwqJK toxin-antitoxin module